jgi:excinuclease ABC subunit A
VFESARKSGFVRVRVDGEIRDLSDNFELDKQKWHNIDIVVDRLVITEKMDMVRISDSTEAALRQAEGIVLVDISGKEEMIFSEEFSCVYCNVSLGEIEPRTFSFNNPHGACSTCTGLGFKMVVDPDLVIPDKTKTIEEGAIEGWSKGGSLSSWHMSQLNSLSEIDSFRIDIPVQELEPQTMDMILNGTKTKIKMSYRSRRGRTFRWNRRFEGVIGNLERRYTETESENVRKDIERYMTSLPCQGCSGQRLKPESLAVTIGNETIMSVSDKSISEAADWIALLENPRTLSMRDKSIASQILKELSGRLQFLLNVGLDYLTLSRTASTLSGGEAQRIRLATQIGSGLMGVLYVCDEPSIGLHPADDYRLINTLKGLRDVGNTVLIVEHDEAIMRAADHIVDLGPGAGEHGGEIVASGSVSKIMASKNSLTGQYLSGRKVIETPQTRRLFNGKYLEIEGAEQNNLNSIDVTIPLGILVCITGVSGSGKSTLINEILYKRLSQHFYRAKDRPGKFRSIKGLENIDKVVNIDQSPIGRTPRSNPATYTGTFTPIRELFAQVPEARSRGYKPGRFSFNVKGGRCEACSGDGYINIEMQFLPDVSVPCEECQASRYNRDALEIEYRGLSISDVLQSTVTEALTIFSNIPRIKTKLQTLQDVGLGYIKLGQPATQLSGGEAQRVKLATELSKRATGQTLYILDEPTTGLSFEDCSQLLKVLQRLVDTGNSVVLIEHHLDLIKSADWIIDLGPGAGDKGGNLVYEGTPENATQHEGSYTGKYLKNILP